MFFIKINIIYNQLTVILMFLYKKLYKFTSFFIILSKFNYNLIIFELIIIMFFFAFYQIFPNYKADTFNEQYSI